MRTWQAFLVAIVPVNIESTEPIHTFQFLEAIKWNFTGTGHELQQFRTLFFVE